LIYELYVEIADKMKYLRTNKKTGGFGPRLNKEQKI